MKKNGISFSGNNNGRDKRLPLSPAMKQVVRNHLKQLESQADEDFLARAEMERKLSSL